MDFFAVCFVVDMSNVMMHGFCLLTSMELILIHCTELMVSTFFMMEAVLTRLDVYSYVILYYL